jgi:hypothetical protein
LQGAQRHARLALAERNDHGRRAVGLGAAKADRAECREDVMVEHAAIGQV